ncbi:MAG: chemotaxis protein CheX [Nitrospirota bacterium]|nr:MAG: chemotaxis protein CheX [Nitrospirota bacterium]
MRFEYIEPFVSSTIRVLDQVIQSDVSRGKISLVSSDEIYGDVTIIIKVEGDSGGDIILNMDEETAVSISNIMTGEDAVELTPLGKDAISELANMLAGNATSALTDLGYKLQIAPPSMVDRNGLIKQIGGLEIFQVPLFTEMGEITMNAVLRVN